MPGLMPLQHNGYVRCELPWGGHRSAYRRDEEQRERQDALHYRGWVLVDVHRWRWAVSDGTGARVRVCRATEPRADALKAFRAKVDAIEDEDETGENMGTTLKVKRVNHDAPMPHYQHDGDAGLDLCSMETVWVYPGKTVKVKTGVAIELERNHVGLVFPRSGLGSKGLTLSNCVGVIDSGYRDEIKMPLHNNNRDGGPMLVNKGDRVCQLVVVRLPSVAIEEVEELADSERGTDGFGSTGV